MSHCAVEVPKKGFNSLCAMFSPTFHPVTANGRKEQNMCKHQIKALLMKGVQGGVLVQQLGTRFGSFMSGISHLQHSNEIVPQVQQQQPNNSHVHSQALPQPVALSSTIDIVHSDSEGDHVAKAGCSITPIEIDGPQSDREIYDSTDHFVNEEVLEGLR